MEPCKFVLVGDETPDNLRLSAILKQVFGKDNVARFLELRPLEPFLSAHSSDPVVVCLDLFSLDVKEATATVGRVRGSFPKAVINLYVDHDEYARRASELPDHWRTRFQHYYKTFKEGPDVEFEPIVRASLRPSILEALHNMSYEPVRLTPVYTKGLVEPEGSPPAKTGGPTSFISYSRKDWPDFVSVLASGLARRSCNVWVDQSFIMGGNDWMDAVGQALQECDTLLLVLSPDALASKYVKMEYRYFLAQDKPVIPLLYKRVATLPFELATVQYVDFSQGDPAPSYSALFTLLASRRQAKP